MTLPWLKKEDSEKLLSLSTEANVPFDIATDEINEVVDSYERIKPYIEDFPSKEVLNYWILI